MGSRFEAELVRKGEKFADVPLSAFKCKHIIGSGAFGKVYLARLDTASENQ